MSFLRTTLRSLFRSPDFTTVVVVTLGLGIGATATIVATTSALLERPIAARDPEQLVAE